jgi:hypothetical protein
MFLCRHNADADRKKRPAPFLFLLAATSNLPLPFLTLDARILLVFFSFPSGRLLILCFPTNELLHSLVAISLCHVVLALVCPRCSWE